MTEQEHTRMIEAQAGVAAARETLKGRERDICDWFKTNLARYPQEYHWIWYRWWEIVMDCEKELGIPHEPNTSIAIGDIYHEWRQATEC
mgnify:CR=1 FL=1